MGTINGHMPYEIGELLKAPFDQSLVKQRTDNKSFYFPTEAFKDRFDEVIGVMNYDYEIKSVRRVESVATGKKSIVEVQLVITIKDDDGIPVKRCEGIGATPMIIVSATGAEKNPNADVVKAEQNAFKHLCQSLFGMANDQLSELNDFGKNERSGGYYSQSQAGNTAGSYASTTLQGLPQGIVTEKLKITEGFSLRGNNIYGKAETPNCKDCDIVIFQKEQSAITSRMPIDQFISTYTVGKELSMKGSYGEFKGRTQFRFHA